MFSDSVLTLAFAAGDGFCGRKRHPLSCRDRVEFTGNEASREFARVTEVASDVARLIARSPVNICTRRTDDG